MNMEREERVTNYLSLEERKREELIKFVLENFEARYVEFVAGKDSKKILYSGDFKEKTFPLELILPGGKAERTVSYEEMADEFFGIVGDHITGGVKGDCISRMPNKETRSIALFQKQNPSCELSVKVSYFPLQAENNERCILLIERFQENPESQFPIAEVWTAKRMLLSPDGDGSSGKKYKIQPRSMVPSLKLPLPKS